MSIGQDDLNDEKKSRCYGLQVAAIEVSFILRRSAELRHGPAATLMAIDLWRIAVAASRLWRLKLLNRVDDVT